MALLAAGGKRVEQASQLAQPEVLALRGVRLVLALVPHADLHALVMMRIRWREHGQHREVEVSDRVVLGWWIAIGHLEQLLTAEARCGNFQPLRGKMRLWMRSRMVW